MEKEYKLFCQNLKVAVEERFSNEKYHVELHTVMKNNAVKYDGLLICSDETELSPNFYMQVLYTHYKQGCSLQELAAGIEEKYFETQKKRRGMELDTSFESCRKRVIFRLISFEKNREILKNHPYIEYLDMAVVFYVLVHQGEDEIGSFIVTDALMEQWNMDEELLFQKALKNTKKLFPLKIFNMYQLMRNMFRDQKYSKDLEKYFFDEMLDISSDSPAVLTNQRGINGAAVILYEDTLKSISDLYQGDYYLLPSSVHEFLAIAYSPGIHQEDLKEMVMEVNGEYVSEDEYLSEHVYFYDAKREKLEICI